MTDSRDNEWTERFLDALRAEPRIRAAARAAGVPIATAYWHKQRDPEFARRWDACLPPTGHPRRPKGARKLDRFLEALAETSNVTAAAEAAELQLSSIYRLRRADAGFARRWYAALAEGYDNLEMELLGRLRAGDSEGAGGLRKLDTAAALRCLAAHRESVAREKGRRTLAEEVATIASINARIDELRLNGEASDKAIAAARKGNRARVSASGAANREPDQ